ncbi:hypothetical protein GT715_19710 [Clostridium beijerinckii]|nr:hypothetical protein [Clostridium beijerinckii]MZK60643.1 hypothetical protein [Clostridium beijerinckii]MZK70918.1 hypothetical protein [Clostridium beijerinckii]MZK76273.1 hypothetical protein [Clostridium beijerinckii]MZK85938.1 hypothetical protein [Clostridium beijerinckii]
MKLGLIILIIMGIHRGIGAFKSFTKRNEQMNEKFDTILEELERTRSEFEVASKKCFLRLYY